MVFFHNSVYKVKRYRKNVQRNDIDRFIGALSGRFPQGVFMTTADYGKHAQRKASTSIPRILTLNGDQVISIMLDNGLGLKPLRGNTQKLVIDSDYFATFEAQKQLLIRKIHESRQDHPIDTAINDAEVVSEDKAIELTPEEDLISLNALAYSLRVDSNRVRRWLESGKLKEDGYQSSGERGNYYFRRDRIEQIRTELEIEAKPASSEEWRQEFLDYAKSRNLSKSYKPVMVKAVFKLVDRDGKVKMDDLVKEFRDFYIQRATSGLPVEFGVPLLIDPNSASDRAIMRLIITNPLERFLIKNYFEYYPDEGVLRIAPQLWQELRHYEMMDVLESADEQIAYYDNRGSRVGR